MKLGYIDKELEQIVGLQTDAPLKRAIMPNGGIRIVEKSAESYGLNHNRNRIPLDNFKYSDKISVCGDMKNGQSLVVIALKDGLDCANQIISKYE